NLGITRKYSINFEGIINFILTQNEEAKSKSIKRWAEGFMNNVTCHECNGERLKVESRHFKIGDKNISDLAGMSLGSLQNWFENIEPQLDENQKQIATEILKELRTRVSFLLNVGLNYLSLNRPAKSLSGGEAQR